ncbi:sigma-70 family RNA polymerase sigma factor [Caldalkalibacillus salinus]|uniref:sigma-70 family RNA polymerase sigma factor n=1 Tax=Caldalkalibacillus salinus TaxID=2803787 RepID=UPI00301B0669
MDIEEKVLLAKKGNDEALYELIITYKVQLYYIAYAYLKNETDALEAIQETTYLAFKNIKKLKEPRFFKTWLIRILLNYCHDELKRRKRMIIRTPEKEDQGKDPHHTSLELEEEIQKLRPHFQDVIILRFYRDLPIADIAHVLDRPEGTVKTWIHQALKQLKKQMKGGSTHG